MIYSDLSRDCVQSYRNDNEWRRKGFFFIFFVKIKEFDVQISKDGFHLDLNKIESKNK